MSNWSSNPERLSLTSELPNEWPSIWQAERKENLWWTLKKREAPSMTKRFLLLFHCMMWGLKNSVLFLQRIFTLKKKKNFFHLSFASSERQTLFKLGALSSWRKRWKRRAKLLLLFQAIIKIKNILNLLKNKQIFLRFGTRFENWGNLFILTWRHWEFFGKDACLHSHMIQKFISQTNSIELGLWTQIWR